jgi:hypothetical protein
VLQEIPEFEEESLGIVGFLWSNISTVHNNPMRRYIDYNNAMDCLRSTHVRFANHLMQSTRSIEINNFAYSMNLVCRLIGSLIVGQRLKKWSLVLFARWMQITGIMFVH